MKGFEATQQAFMAHIRDPEHHPFDGGIEDRRLNVYRELFFNNVKGFLDTGFPVLQSLYAPERWAALARQFFAQHDCRSPYFVDISKEFVEFLSNEYTLSPDDPPFLLELAHYEWVELAISVKKTDTPLVFAQTDSHWQRIEMSPVAMLLSYQFPVHRISEDFQPQAPDDEPTYLIVYRDRDDDVSFTLVNAVTAHLLSVLQQLGHASVEELSGHMQAAMPHLPEETVVQGCKDTVMSLVQQDILLPAT